MSQEAHYRQSSYRERVAEHVMLGDLLAYAWVRAVRVAVLRGETDVDGYDLILGVGQQLRHIQLKATIGTAPSIAVPCAVFKWEGGCTIVMHLADDHARKRLTITRYALLERPKFDLLNSKGMLKAAKKPRSGDERPGHVSVKLGQFEQAATVEALAAHLFPKEFVTGAVP